MSDGCLRIHSVDCQLFITIMTALVILNNLCWIIPLAIVFILGHDLLLNQSALSQYFHWISFLLMGISTASLSGWLDIIYISRASLVQMQWIGQS